MPVHAQVLPGAVAHGALAPVVHAPEQRLVVAPGGVVQQRHERAAIQRVAGGSRGACGVEHRRAPVHGHAGLRAGAAGGNHGGPVGNPGHADAAFGQVHLAAHQGPVVREAFAAVVAGEHHQCVALQPFGAQQVHQAANAFVHVVDHAAIGVDVAAVQVEQVALHLLRQRLVVACFPRPVGRGVVQAQEEWRAAARATGHAAHKVQAVVGDQVGEVAALLLLGVVQVQVVLAGGAAVREVVHPARHGAKELVIARTQRAERGRIAQVPLAHQRRAVARIAQQRGQRGVLGR